MQVTQKIQKRNKNGFLLLTFMSKTITARTVRSEFQEKLRLSNNYLHEITLYFHGKKVVMCILYLLVTSC
jgi:hypothetical protein